MNPFKFLIGRIETSVIFGALLLVAVLLISTNGQWLGNVPSVLRVTAQVGIIAIGQSLLMTSGEVDLSVGSVFAFVSVIFIWLTGAAGLGVESAFVLSLLGIRTRAVRNRTLRANGAGTYAARRKSAGSLSDRKPSGICCSLSHV